MPLPQPTPTPTPSVEPAAPPGPRAWSSRDRLALALCMLVGFALAVAPHAASLATRGTLEYLADGDDVLYMAIARIPHHGENSLRDPFSRQGESAPTLYAWAQFVPISRLLGLVGAPSILTNLAWRGLGGPLLGASLFVLFRRLLGVLRYPAAWALGLSLICLADPGFNGGRSLVQALDLFDQLREGATRSTRPEALAQYRVVTPLLNFPFLLLLVASLVPGGRRTRLWTIAGALCLGLCFQLYFFFWTAALPALGVVLILELLRGWRDTERRTESWSRARTIGLVLAGGMVLGTPQVYSNARAFADPSYKPILQRLSRGWKVEPGSPTRTAYLRNAWFWGKFAAATALIALFRPRNLGLIWWISLIGFALVNSAIVTGLEFENYHWNYIHAPFTEILLLAAIAQIVEPAFSRRPAPLLALWIAPIALVGLALAWRPFEALHASEAVANARTIDALRDIRPALDSLGPDRLLAGPFETNVALLYTRAGELYQTPHTSHSTLIPDLQVHERHALNAWLQGLSADEYARSCAQGRFQVGPDTPVEWRPEAIAAVRTRLFREVDADAGATLLARFRPDTLLRRTSQGEPPRGGPWTPIRKGETWSLWSRDRADSPKAER